LAHACRLPYRFGVLGCDRFHWLDSGKEEPMISKHTLLLVFTLTTPLLPAAEIHDTIESGEPAKVAALLRKDPGLLQAKNAEGDEPLHLAALRDDLAMIELLLEAGADPKEDDPAIIAAAMSSETEMVRLLLERGANPNAEQKGNCTAIGYAVMIGAPLPQIEMLLTAGADPLRVANPGSRSTRRVPPASPV
jgi:uncharacterized protein